MDSVKQKTPELQTQELLAECFRLLEESNSNTRDVTNLTWRQVVSRSRLTGFLSGMAGAAAVIALAALIKKAARSE